MAKKLTLSKRLLVYWSVWGMYGEYFVGKRPVRIDRLAEARAYAAANGYSNKLQIVFDKPR